MYFWQIEELKQRLVKAPLTDREVLPYLIIISTLMSAVWFVPGDARNSWDQAGTAISVMLAIFGTIWIFQRNGADAGQQFLQRYLSIGWVVGVRWFAGAILALGVFYFFLSQLDLVEETTTWYEMVIFALAEIGLYWRIGHHIQGVAVRSAEEYS